MPLKGEDGSPEFLGAVRLPFPCPKRTPGHDEKYPYCHVGVTMDATSRRRVTVSSPDWSHVTTNTPNVVTLGESSTSAATNLRPHAVPARTGHMTAQQRGNVPSTSHVAANDVSGA